MSNTTSETGEINVTRVFRAPRELVFQCMLEPEHLTHFWGPVGTTAPLDRIKVDARPGGVFETVIVNDADGSEHHSRAIYIEITPPSRLVWEEPELGIIASSDFIDLGDGRTEVRVHQSNVPNMFRTEEAIAGFEGSFNRFQDYLDTL
jgi:uncharacterized protein YndB with AHSA1/START domain